MLKYVSLTLGVKSFFGSIDIHPPWTMRESDTHLYQIMEVLVSGGIASRDLIAWADWRLSNISPSRLSEWLYTSGSQLRQVYPSGYIFLTYVIFSDCLIQMSWSTVPVGAHWPTFSFNVPCQANLRRQPHGPPAWFGNIHVFGGMPVSSFGHTPMYCMSLDYLQDLSKPMPPVAHNMCERGV